MASISTTCRRAHRRLHTGTGPGEAARLFYGEGAIRDAVRQRGVDPRTRLVYFADAESEPIQRLIRDVEWETIKGSLIAEVRRLS
jgi:hypothetical protein